MCIRDSYINVTNDDNRTAIADTGNDILIGDNATAIFNATLITDSNARQDQITTIATLHGNNDYIYSSLGKDILLGGQGIDTLTSGSGDAQDTDGLGDIILGDMGQATFATNGNGRIDNLKLIQVTSLDTSNSVGGNDIITSGMGRDVVLGGNPSDTINTHAGNDVVVGDSGQATFNPTNNQLVSIQTIDPTPVSYTHLTLPTKA